MVITYNETDEGSEVQAIGSEDVVPFATKSDLAYTRVRD